MLKVRSYHPDVAIVDIRMPPTQTDEGIEAAREIRASTPSGGVLVLSQHVRPHLCRGVALRECRGAGYLLKDRVTDVDDFTAAVQRVADGGSALDPLVVSELVGRNRGNDPIAQPVAERAGGARADGRGTVQSGDRAAPLHLAQSRREARDEHLHEAAAARRARRPPARSGRAALPRFVALPTEYGLPHARGRPAPLAASTNGGSLIGSSKHLDEGEAGMSHRPQDRGCRGHRRVGSHVVACSKNEGTTSFRFPLRWRRRGHR